ncbi:unnamed protein product, partial [Prorocentrum cordatum]
EERARASALRCASARDASLGMSPRLGGLLEGVLACVLLFAAWAAWKAAPAGVVEPGAATRGAAPMLAPKARGGGTASLLDGPRRPGRVGGHGAAGSGVRNGTLQPTTRAGWPASALLPDEPAPADGAAAAGLPSRRASEESVYSFLDAGMTCNDVGLADVSSSDECFGSAMSFLEMSGTPTQSIPTNSLGFSCIYDTSVGMVLFALSTGTSTVASPSWQYVCPGTFTTTASSTNSATLSLTTKSSTATTVTTTTATTASSATSFSTSSTATTSSRVDYTLLPAGQTCYEAGMQDVTSSAECFGLAMTSVDLGSAETQVFFGDASPNSTVPDSIYQFICIGVLTTTGSSTNTVSTSATSVTFVTSTATSTATSTSTPTSATLTFSLTATATATTASSATSLSTSSTATTSSRVDYTLLPAGQTCYEAGMQDVTSSAECFGLAMTSVDLGSAETQVFFGDASPNSTVPDSTYQFICIGVLTTTGSSTTTISSSSTSITSVTSTATSTTTISTTATSSTSTSATSSRLGDDLLSRTNLLPAVAWANLCTVRSLECGERRRVLQPCAALRWLAGQRHTIYLASVFLVVSSTCRRTSSCLQTTG